MKVLIKSQKFFGGKMDILSIGIDKINLVHVSFYEGDPETIIIVIIVTFILIQKIGFTESLPNWKTFTEPNSAQIPFLYVITQTLKTVNVDIELDYLPLLKTNFSNYTNYTNITYMMDINST